MQKNNNIENLETFEYEKDKKIKIVQYNIVNRQPIIQGYLESTLLSSKFRKHEAKSNKFSARLQFMNHVLNKQNR